MNGADLRASSLWSSRNPIAKGLKFGTPSLTKSGNWPRDGPSVEEMEKLRNNYLTPPCAAANRPCIERNNSLSSRSTITTRNYSIPTCKLIWTSLRNRFDWRWRSFWTLMIGCFWTLSLPPRSAAGRSAGTGRARPTDITVATDTRPRMKRRPATRFQQHHSRRLNQTNPETRQVYPTKHAD